MNQVENEMHIRRVLVSKPPEGSLIQLSHVLGYLTTVLPLPRIRYNPLDQSEGFISASIKDDLGFDFLLNLGSFTVVCKSLAFSASHVSVCP